jgi:hypothetical protein
VRNWCIGCVDTHKPTPQPGRAQYEGTLNDMPPQNVVHLKAKWRNVQALACFQVRDSSGLNDVSDFTVIINDVNNNAPVFQFPNASTEIRLNIEVRRGNSVLLKTAASYSGWLRHCAASRKVASSFPDVIGCFNPTRHTVALGPILPLTQMSTRNVSFVGGGWSKDWLARNTDNFTAICESNI